MKLHTCFSALLLALSPAVDAATYIAERYDIAGATNTALWAINNRNQVVGEATFDGEKKAFYGALGEAPVFFDGPPKSVASFITGITDDGVLVGSYATELVDDGFGALVPRYSRGFTWDAANGFDEFEVAGAANTVATGISSNGRYLVGYSPSYDRWDAWLMDRDTGVIETTASGVLAFGTGVNNKGEAVGARWTFSDGFQSFDLEGFSYKSGVTDYFQLNNQTETNPIGLNNRGVLSGYIYRPDGGVVAFIGGISDYSLVNWRDWNTFAYAVNDLGLAVGMASDNAGNQQALIFRAIPEPASLGLIFMGLAGAVALGRQTRLRR